jgi:hypothetical protein
MQRASIRLVASICASVAGATLAQAKDIDGQVFIVTRGAQAIKLPLVQVAAFRKTEMEAHIREVDTRLSADRAKADAVVKETIEALQRAKRAGAGSEHWVEDDMKAHGPIKDINDAMRRGSAVGKRQGEAQKRISSAEARLREAGTRREFVYSAARYLTDLPVPLATAKTDADGHFKLTVADEEVLALVATSSRTVFDHVEKYSWVVRLAPHDTTVTLSNDNLTSSRSADSLLATTD